MKSKNSLFSKFILLFAFIGIYVTISGSMQTSATKMQNNLLIQENRLLTSNLLKLDNKLDSIEMQIHEINEYDLSLYTEIMGVNFDTTNFDKFRDDSAKVVFSMHDTIFQDISDRTLYASEMLAVQLNKLTETSKFFKNNKHAINYYPTISPIKTKDFVRVSSPYGFRNDPFTNKTIFHEGVDISAVVGTPIHATASGKVVKIVHSKKGYGNRIVIEHYYGFETLYAHVGRVNVETGQRIKKDQIIGTVGNTGRSTGPHLHYEIRKNGDLRDPLGYFYTYLSTELLAMN